jgi:hypothetical protein
MENEYIFLALYEQLQRREHAVRRNRLRLYRRQLRDALNPFELPERAFRETFRLNREAARFVVNALTGQIPEARIQSGIPQFLKVSHIFCCGYYHALDNYLLNNLKLILCRQYLPTM